MTTRPVAGRDTTQQLAYRVAAMLLGIGTLHFVAPKPFDSIVPVELPGSPRLYTYGSGVAELAIGALLVPRRTRRSAALAAAALFVGGLSRQPQHVPAVVGQAVAHAPGRPGPVAHAASNDHHRAQDSAQQLTHR